MKKWLLGMLAVCLCTPDASADQNQDLLTNLRSRSDVVVLGEFTSEPFGVMEEVGVVEYHARFKIAQLLKGEVLGERKPGGTIMVNATRFELEAGDRLPQFKKGGQAILFLTCNDKQSPPGYRTCDLWFGIQPAFPAMVKTLAAMPADKTTNKSEQNVPAPPNSAETAVEADPVTDVPPDEPQPAESVKADLAGEWRIFLPAGYELEITLQDLGSGRYTLQPARYTFSATYRTEGDRLVSEETDDTRQGQFAWKMVSPYLMTLVDQIEGVGSDYSGAIMFRRCPTAILEQQRARGLEEKSSNRQHKGHKGVPQITVEQLSTAIRKEGFQWRFIGREIEFISSRRTGGQVHIDGMEKEILDTAVIHPNYQGDDTLAKLGERIRVRGLIVDQWYGVWQIWPYSISNVEDLPNQTQKKVPTDAVE